MKRILKSRVLLVVLMLSSALVFQDCFIFHRKNKCDGCPAMKRKKVRKSTKGSI